MNTKIAIYILIVIVVVLGAFYFFSQPSSNVPAATNQEQTQTGQQSTTPPTTTSTTTTTTTTTVTPIPTPTTAKVSVVSILNFAFVPKTITINKGDSIIWKNQDSVAHQPTGGSIQSPVISTGQTYSLTFNTAGTFNYHCAIHPSMTGTVIVK